jgi:hypothetical protein
MTFAEIGSIRRLENLKEALRVLTASAERLQKIQQRDAKLLLEVSRALDLRPDLAHNDASELIGKGSCDELNLRCIEAIQRLTDALRVEAIALRRTQTFVLTPAECFLAQHENF